MRFPRGGIHRRSSGAKALRRFAVIVRENARELALLDAIDCGNPVKAMVGDAEIAAAQIDFFAAS